MKNQTLANQETKPHALINPQQLWAIENELMDIPIKYRDSFWNELLASYTSELIGQE